MECGESEVSEMTLRPPKSVPGPYIAPAGPPLVPSQTLPHMRYFTPTGAETLGEIAARYYGNPREAVRIFNANRSGLLRDDRTPGFLLTLHDVLPVGQPLVIP